MIIKYREALQRARRKGAKKKYFLSRAKTQRRKKRRGAGNQIVGRWTIVEC